MDIDDFDVVVTGTSPQRSTLREAQAREAPARANCSKLKIQADVRSSEDGSLYHIPHQRGQQTSDPADSRHTPASGIRMPGQRSSPSYCPGDTYTHATCRERDAQWPGDPTVTMSPAHTGRRENTRLDRHAQSSSVDALHALKNSIHSRMQFEADENQGSDANATASLPQAGLHLPAFERLMQVMTRLEKSTKDDNGETSSVLSGQASQTYRSPAKKSPAGVRSNAALDPHGTGSNTTSPAVASHPITIGVAVSPDHVPPRPMLLHDHEESDALSYDLDQDTEQQPWCLKTPSTFHDGAGFTDSQRDLVQREGSCTTAFSAAPPKQYFSADQSAQSDDKKKAEPCTQARHPNKDEARNEEFSEAEDVYTGCENMCSHKVHSLQQDGQQLSLQGVSDEGTSNHETSHAICDLVQGDNQDHVQLEQHALGLQSEQLHRSQDAHSDGSPFPGVPEVPWPTPGSALRGEDQLQIPAEPKTQTYVQPQISLDWEAVNKQLNTANISAVQCEATHDWHVFESSVHKAVLELISEYEKQGQVVQQLLSVADGASTEKTRHSSALKALQRERDTLSHDLKREKEANNKRFAVQKKEFQKTKTQVRALEGTIKKLHRDAEAAAKASTRHDMERQALETSTVSTQAEVSDLRKRVSTLNETVSKAQAESKRLQGYSKGLEAAQRLKDTQLTELEENKRDSVRRIDELERSCIVASKDAQQQEAQVLALQRQLKEAQVSIRNTEREADQRQGDISRLTTQLERAEQRAIEAEASMKEATGQMRSLTSRTTALEAQLRTRECEVEDLQSTITNSQQGKSETESRGLQLQADLRSACADIANLTAQLGVQTAVARSREVEINELKSSIREASVRQEAAGDALDDTVDENKRLSIQCAQLQCSLKTQVATLRARESELDDLRTNYAAAEVKIDNLSQRLNMSGVELSRTDEALKLSQRQARSLGNRLNESEARCQALQESLQTVEAKKGDVQVLNKNTAQQLAAARAEADRVKTALQAAEKQLAAKDDRIASLHADLHILDAQKDELKHAVADASGAVLSASDNSSALEARVRTLLAQLKDRDEVEAVLKEQLSSLQTQRDRMEDSLKEYIKQDEASKSAQAAGLNRVDSLLLQLTARGEEVESLRSQLTLAEDTVREMKTSSAKAAAQLESVELRGQTQANRITVLTNQLQARDSVADALKAQLHALEEKQSSTQNVAEESHREVGRSDAMLVAERARAQELEKQLSDAQQVQMDAFHKLETADADAREAKEKAIESGHKCAHLESQVKTLQARINVLDAELAGAQQEEATLREALLESQSERSSSAHIAAKENSALSSSLRASHSRMVVLEKQLSERDQQIKALRVQASQAHANSGGAAQQSREAAAQVQAADQRAQNLTARNKLMQTQLTSLQQEIEGLREALNDEKERGNADSVNAAQASMTMRALHAQISNLRSSVKVLEYQLSEKVDEAERLRAMLTMHDDSAQTAATAVVSAQLAEAAQEQALEDSKKRVSCLQRRLDMQQSALQDAQADASAANDASDVARRQVAQYAAEVHRATLAAHAAATYASGLENALKSADVELAEMRGLLLKQNAASGAANSETSVHMKGLESQIRSLHWQQQLLKNHMKDGQKAMEKAEKTAEDMKNKLECANSKAARQESELTQARKQLESARKTHQQTLAVSTERNAELEVLRNELRDLVVNQDAMALAGADSVKSEQALRAGIRALDSELRSVHAALAKKDADALAADEALVSCRDAYRAAKSEAAAAHERCEALRKQVRSLQSAVQRHATAVQAAEDGALDAQQAALHEAERADAVEAHVARLEKVVHRFNLQQVALTCAQEKHDAAVTRAAEAVADARKIAAAERENTTRARQNAVDAGALVSAMQQEIQQLRAAHDVQVQAADAATSATKDLQQALLDQQAEVRVLAAEASGAAEHAASCSREVSVLQAQLLDVKVQMHEQAEALVLAEQQLQDASLERVADKKEAIRTATSLQHADANVESLHRDLEKQSEGVEELRQRLSDTEVLLQQEKQEHGVTRAEQASIEVALQRKSVSLQNSEAEKSRLATRLEHAEETVRELTHAKLESTTQDATARKAQHASEVSLRHAQDRISQLNQQLQSLTEIKNEQAQAIQDLEGSLSTMRVQAAQQQAADSASAAASARSEEKALQVKQQVVSLQQELSDVKKAKQGLEAQLAHESDERMKSSEELGRAAKAMLRAQKQIESLKKKGASQTASLNEAKAEIVTLRGAAMDAQMELKQSAVEGPHVLKLEADVKSLRDKLRAAQLQASSEAEARQQVSREAGQLEDSVETAAVQLQRAEGEVAASQKESGHLKLQVTQLTHSLRECEKRLEKTREQLSASMSKEERFHARGKQAYARIRAAWASTKGTNKVAGAIAAASREMRPVEIVGIYEDQKSQADAEVKKLSAENAVLLNQVRDLENKELQAQLADTSRTVTQLRAEVQRQDVDAGDAARMHARQLAEAQGRAEMLQEENATLLVELNKRPSHKDYTAVKREGDIMRQRLSRLESQKETDSGMGYNADSPSAGTEKQHEQQLMTTKDRIARDKRLAAMGLSQIDRMPHVLSEIVQDACLALDVPEPTHLHSAILRVARRANQVAQLDAFVESVCGCIFKDGADFVPAHLQEGEAVSVVPVLQLWQEKLHAAAHIDHAVRQIDGMLRGADVLFAPTLDGIVASVQELVWNQSNAKATLATFKSLDSGFRDNPDAAIVRHFQDLFSLQSAVGCIPMMSKVYAEHQAGITFLQALSDMLGTHRSSAACLDRVEALLKTAAGRELQLKQGLVGKLHPAAVL